MNQERAAVVAEALSWVGTPFHDRGMIKGRSGGVDCAMSVYLIYRAALPHRVPALDVPDYSGQWHLSKSTAAGERYLSVVLAYATEIAAPHGPAPGDLVLYRLAHAWAHGAIVIDWPRIAHASSDAGQFIEDRGDQGRLAGRPRRFFTLDV